MRRAMVAAAAVVMLLAGCSDDDDTTADADRDLGDVVESTTSTSTTVASPTTTTSEAAPPPAEPLQLTPLQFVGLFNASAPLADPDLSTLAADEIAAGVYGSSVDVGVQVLMFADSPTAKMTASAVVIDMDLTGGSYNPRMLISAGAPLAEDLDGVTERYAEVVVPDLASVRPGETRWNLGGIDLVLDADPVALTFVFVSPEGTLPAWLS